MAGSLQLRECDPAEQTPVRRGGGEEEEKRKESRVAVVGRWVGGEQG